MAHAISYARFSTPKQAWGDSLNRQLRRTKKYCETHGHTLDDDETLTDQGLSGYKGEHRKSGALGLFLAAVEGGKVPRGTYLILEHLDRFSRENPLIAVSSLINLITAGIHVVTLFDERIYFDTSKTIGDDLIGAIRYMIVAHGESSRKADLLRESWEDKRMVLAESQIRTGNATRPAWLDVEITGQDGKGKPTGKFVKNRPRCATVRRVFDLVANGMSTYGVCQLFNDPDHRTPALSGNKKNKNGWNTARVSEIIKSDAPLGWFQPHKRDGAKKIKVGEPIKDYYPIVVSQELANRARYQLGTRAFPTKDRKGEGQGATGKTITNLFTGLCKCALCGSNMYLFGHGSVGGRGGRRRFHGGYLRCSEYKRNGKCSNTASIPYAVFEKFIIELIGGFSIPDDVGEDTATQELMERLADTKAEAAKTTQAIKTWQTAYEEKPMRATLDRIDELASKHDTLTADIAEKEKQLVIEKGKTKPSDEMEAVKRLRGDLHSTDKQVRLLARVRTSAGLRQFVSHFLCFPNRGVIAEYNLGNTMCVTRCWLTTDGEYEAYHTGWDYGQRKGKPWLASPLVDWQNMIHDYNPLSKHESQNERFRARIALVNSMELEGRSPQPGYRVPAKVRAFQAIHHETQAEDFYALDENFDIFPLPENKIAWEAQVAIKQAMQRGDFASVKLLANEEKLRLSRDEPKFYAIWQERLRQT